MIDEIGEQLAGWGKVARLETTGRVSGRPVTTAVGYAEQDDGSVVVAAGRPNAGWALNLRAQPRCRVTIADETREFVALELAGDQRNHAITELILKYGTSAERLGAGPAFRLVRRDA